MNQVTSLTSSSAGNIGLCRNQLANSQCRLAFAILIIMAIGATLLFMGLASYQGWWNTSIALSGQIAMLTAGSVLLSVSLTLMCYAVKKCRTEIDSASKRTGKIGRPTDLENVRNEYQLNNNAQVYDCTQKDISALVIRVKKQDNRELDVICLKRISEGFNYLDEPVPFVEEFPVQFYSSDSADLYEEGTNKYFVVKDSPSGGVEILEHRLSTQGAVEEIRRWNVDDSVYGCYPCYHFAARTV